MISLWWSLPGRVLVTNKHLQPPEKYGFLCLINMVSGEKPRFLGDDIETNGGIHEPNQWFLVYHRCFITSIEQTKNQRFETTPRNQLLGSLRDGWDGIGICLCPWTAISQSDCSQKNTNKQCNHQSSTLISLSPHFWWHERTHGQPIVNWWVRLWCLGIVLIVFYWSSHSLDFIGAS